MSKKKSSARKVRVNSHYGKPGQPATQPPTPMAAAPGKKNMARAAGKGEKSRNRILLIAVAAVVVVAAAATAGVLLTRSPAPAIPSDNTPAPTASAEDVIIDEVMVYNITESSISATWHTNVPVKGSLVARDVLAQTSFSSWVDDEYLTEHDVTVQWLAEGREYQLTVIAEDAVGGKAHFELPGTYTTLVPPAEMKLSAGDPAPAFKLASLTGEQVSLQDYTGRLVMLVFWDLNCGSCRDELPYLQRVFETSSPDGPALLTVLKAGDAALAEAYMKAGSFTFPVLLDGDSSVTGSYTIVTFPTSFLLDQTGTIHKIRQESFKSASEVSDFIK
jgi:peroxiredoxin